MLLTCLASRLSGVATLLSTHKAATARVNEYFMLDVRDRIEEDAE